MNLAIHDHPGRTTARAIRALTLFLPVSLALMSSCGRAPQKVSAPSSPPSGVESGVMSVPVDVLEFSRFVTEVIASDWSHDGRMTPNWSYEATSGAWQLVSDCWHTTYVGNGTSSTEIRDQTTVTIKTTFLHAGVIQPDLMSADRARMDVSIRRHRYATDPGYALGDGYDVQVVHHSEFALSVGNADTLRAAGTLTGWADRKSNGRSWRAGLDGSMTLRLEYPGHFVSCPGLELAADIRVLDGNSEIDRYRGTFVAARDDSRYTGALVSQHGAGRFEMDADRGCPPPVATLRSLLGR